MTTEEKNLLESRNSAIASTISILSESSSDSSDSDDDQNQGITIHELCVSGTLHEIKRFVGRERHRKVAAKDEHGRVALHYCALLNRLDVAEFLIRKRSMVDPKDSRHHTPLHLAAQGGHVEMCRLLLDSKANVNYRDDDCWTALHHAVHGRFFDVSTLLVKRGANLNAEDHRHGRTALHLSAELGFAEFVDMLIVRGANMYASGDSLYSMTPLHLACMHGHSECVRVLVMRGADLSTLSGFLDKSPLHLASEFGHYQSVKILLDHGADIEQMGARINGCTALHLAAGNNRLDVVELLVAKGAYVEQSGRYSNLGTALHMAAGAGHLKILQALVGRFSANVDAKDVNGNTPLHVACKSGNMDVAGFLVRARADVTIRSMTQKTAFQLCEALTDREKLVAISEEVSREKQLERQAEEQEMQRREQEHADMIKREEQRRQQLEYEQRHILETKTAFITAMSAVVNTSGELSALQIVAEEFYDQDINTILSEETLCTALTRATNNGFGVIVNALLQWPGIDINAQEMNGNTALHYAAKLGYREIAEQLLLAGCKVGILNQDLKVAANLATSSYLSELIRNPTLIKDKQKYQNSILRNILETKRRAATGSLNIGSCREKIVEFETDAVKPDIYGGIAAGVSEKSNLGAGKKSKKPRSEQHSKKEQDSRRAKKEADDDPGADANADAEAVALDSEAFARGRFGAVPRYFGGCRLDFFSLDKEEDGGDHANQKDQDDHDNSAEGSGMENSGRDPKANLNTQDTHVLLSLKTLQRGYLPTAFDSEEEWTEVKDYLWLLGQVYSRKQAVTEVDIGQGDESQEEFKADTQIASVHLLQSQSHSDDGSSNNNSAASLRRHNLEREMTHLHHLAVTMNNIQKLFLDVYGQVSTTVEGGVRDNSSINNAATSTAFVGTNRTGDSDKKHREKADTITRLPMIGDNSTSQAGARSGQHTEGDTNTLLEQEAKIDDCILAISKLRLVVPPNLIVQDFHRLILFSRQVEIFTDEVMYVCFFHCPNLDAALADIAARILKAGYKVKVQVFGSSNIAAMKKYIFSYCHKVLGVLTSEVTRYVCKLVDLSLCSCTSIHDNWLLHTLLSNPNLLSEDGGGGGGGVGGGGGGASVYRGSFSVASSSLPSIAATSAISFIDTYRTTAYCGTFTARSSTRAKSQQPPYPNLTRETAVVIQKHLSDLYLNAPRYMRLCVDNIFETAQWLKTAAEKRHPIDSVRAHLWAFTGRRMIRRKMEERLQKKKKVTGLSLWLGDLLIEEEYLTYFREGGFRILSDFLHLTAAECEEMFDFLKFGDLRRLAKNITSLSDAVVRSYEAKADAINAKLNGNGK